HSALQLHVGDATAVARISLPRMPQAAAAAGGALLLAWLVGAALLLSRCGAALWLLRQRLERRRPIERGPLWEMVAALRPGEAPARLSASPDLLTPIAWGVRRPEICVPERLLTELQ